MAHCVNTSSKEFKELSRQTNLTVPVLKAKVGIWQSKNGYENYPSKEDIFATMPLANRVGIYKNTLSYAQTIGIKERVAYYNKHNPKIFVQFQQIGQADMYSWKIQELKGTTNDSKNPNQTSLFGLDNNNLEFHINTLNVVGQFLENIGVEKRLVPEFLAQDGSVVEGAIAAANFIKGTVDIIDDLEKGRAEAWNKLPEEAAHWWYRLLDTNSPLKDSLLTASLTSRKEEELRNSLYGKAYKGPKVVGKLALDSNGNITSKPALSAIREEAIGQLIAEAIKRIEDKQGSPEDYSFLKKFLEWINSVINSFKNTTEDPFEVAAMKILSSDLSDLMTLAEYRKINNIVNFADVLTEQSVAPIDYTIINDIGFEGVTFMTDKNGDAGSGYVFHFKESDRKSSPAFELQEELDAWVHANVPQHDLRQKEIIQEVRDNQIFFDRLLNKSFRKKSKFLPKTLRKYFDIIDSTRLKHLKEWNISAELQQITKKLSEEEKKQIVQTNGYTNIAPTLKVLPDLLQKYRKNPIVLSEPIKIDGAKKQELSILNGIKDMIKLENPNLRTITSEEFAAEAHNWLETNYLLGFANEKYYLSYRTDQTFSYLSDRQTNEDLDITNLTDEEILRLPAEERQRIANIVGLTKQNPDVYHNKVSIRFNDKYHLRSSHFDMSPSAWGNLTYFYSGKNKWKDAVLLHEIQNDNIEFLREFKDEKADLQTSLGRYLQNLNLDLLENISQIETGGKKIVKDIFGPKSKQHLHLNYLLNTLNDLPLQQGLTQFKENISENLNLYESNNILNKPEELKELIEQAYLQKRRFADLQKRGGLKSLLTKEDSDYLKTIIQELNEATELVYNPPQWLEGENQMEPGDEYESGINLAEKRRRFSYEVISIQNNLNDKFKELYGDGVPKITLSVAAKPLPRNSFVSKEYRDLNPSINYLLMVSEEKINKQLSNDIEIRKKNFIASRNATNLYNFNLKLSKITSEQYSTLVENYKYNKDLLERLVDEQAEKDIKEVIVDKNINKEVLMLQESNLFDYLKEKALKKKAELEEEYGKVEEEVKQTLEVEMNYFTPLIHHLIQKHINQYGKDFPMYFSGYNITKLTQGNNRTALIYAGKDEINTINKKKFEINGKTYTLQGENALFINNTLYKVGGSTKTTQEEYDKAKQEYEKAYQQAVERQAKKIKFEAAIQIGLLRDSGISEATDENIEIGIKKLNEYKRQSKENLDRVINTIMNISDSKPIETGAIYNAMTQINGIKLIWQEAIPGIRPTISSQASTATGGYLVDLSNYNYNVPVLYGLKNPNNDNQVENQQEINYSLKAVDILQSDKAKQVFEKGKKSNWDLNKILTELQVPKEQKQLILDISNNIYNVWHSSNDKIDSFIKENINGYFATVKKGSPKAVFFTANKPPQESFLSQREYQKQFSVKMDKPLIVDTKTGYSRETEGFKALVNRALDNGYDGVIVKNVDDNGFNGDVYISLNSDNISTDLREQLALELASKYSYTVEINTAKEKEGLIKDGTEFKVGEDYYYSDPNRNVYKILYSKDNGGGSKNISKQEFEDARQNSKPTQHYSDLTVPGGTNYTENAIQTPNIINSSIAHINDFAKSIANMLGWFRSDDKLNNSSIEEYQEEKDGELVDRFVTIGDDSKTRRILEIQSDLFQKWRNKFEFENNKYTAEKDTESVWHYYKNGSEINSNEYTKIWNIFLETYLDNADAFTKLLQKDNNWVTFFVKSIIQDTAKQTVTEVQESDVEAKVRELEKEGLLEIDCKGKLKAEKGLATSFVKGGKWKVIKDLKGYPTHKEGGVDLTIGKGGVSIKNGNTQFTAKYGLVIPKN